MMRLFFCNEKTYIFNSFFILKKNSKLNPVKKNKTKILIAKNKDRIVVMVLQKTKPINIFSTKLDGTFINLVVKNPNVVKRNKDKQVDKRIAIIEIY